jgi:hypothetical protein
MDKLKLAHDWAMKSFLTDGFKDEAERAAHAWKYADAMQAEAEKRNKAEAAQKRKEIREMLNAPNTFIEREGQHFDDVEEWQPDWSQAPEWANSWGMAEIGQAWWLSGEWHVNNRGGFSSTGFIKTEKAPSFNYQGNWQDSLRKRPQ